MQSHIQSLGLALCSDVLIALTSGRMKDKLKM